MTKKKKYKDDDDRVIAPMNVEGMPWYHDGKKNQPESKDNQPLSKKETAQVTLYAVFAGLTVALIMGAALFLFILFCIHVWFK